MSKTKTYIAQSDAEAKALHDGTQTVIVIPFDEQPTMEAIADYHFDLCYRGVFKYKSDGENWLPFCPYIPGDVIAVKEAWGCPPADHPRCHDGRKPQEGDRIVYRAKPADDYQWGPGKPSQSGFVWRPAQWMPPWVVRTHLPVVSVACRQCQEVTDQQLDAYGCRARYSWCEPANDMVMDYSDSDDYERRFKELFGKDAWNENHWCWFVEVRK